MSVRDKAHTSDEVRVGVVWPGDAQPPALPCPQCGRETKELSHSEWGGRRVCSDRRCRHEHTYTLSL